MNHLTESTDREISLSLPCKGVNNLVDSADAVKRKDYLNSITSVAKAALKWTMIGALFFGLQRAISIRPVYINETHQQALQGLNGGINSTPNTAQTLLDHYFEEQPVYKRWPESGKDYIRQCFESDSPEASSSIRYFVKKGLENKDSGLVRNVIKTCASSRTTTQSCLVAQKVLIEESADTLGTLKKIANTCNKSKNTFCKDAQDFVVSEAAKEHSWNDVIKRCAKSKALPETCLEPLKSLEEILNKPSPESLKIAKSIASQCGKSTLPACQKATDVMMKQVAASGSYQEVKRLVQSQCKNLTEKCIDIIEETSTFFLPRAQNDPIPDYFDVYFELTDPSSPPSSISTAIALVEACLRIPSSKVCRTNARNIVTFLEKSRESLKSSDGLESRISREVLAKLQNKIDEFNQQLSNLPSEGFPQV